MGSLACLALPTIFTAGCTDPQGDYDDYRQRTASTRGVVPTQGGTHQADGGTTCSLSEAAAPPDFSSSGVPDFSGTYFAECLARLALCDVNTTLRYHGTVTKQGDGSYQFTYQPLAIGSPTISTVVGTPFSNIATIAADGSFVQVITNVLTPGSSNPFSGNDLTISNATFTGFILDSGHYCAELDGTVTVLGSPIDLNGAGDICLFRRVASADEAVDYSLSDFHCP